MGPEYSVLPLSFWPFEFGPRTFLRHCVTSQVWWGRPIGLPRSASALAQVFYENGCDSLETRPSNQVQGWSLAVRALNYIDRPTSTKGSQSNRLAKRWVAQAAAFSSPFRRQCGLPPFNTSSRRLHYVRSDLLLRTNGPPVVTRTAAHNGSLGFGRFSQHYQRLFGELPSATVMRARRRVIP